MKRYLCDVYERSSQYKETRGKLYEMGNQYSKQHRSVTIPTPSESQKIKMNLNVSHSRAIEMSIMKRMDDLRDRIRKVIEEGNSHMWIGDPQSWSQIEKESNSRIVQEMRCLGYDVDIVEKEIEGVSDCLTWSTKETLPSYNQSKKIFKILKQ